ncbi:histidinol dehydrogenase [Shigella flexneri]
MDNVQRGDSALREYSAKFEKPSRCAESDCRRNQQASGRLSDELSRQCRRRFADRYLPHGARLRPVISNPARRALPAGYPPYRLGAFYIPGGLRRCSYRINAATPTRIAGCKKVVLVHHRLLPMRSCTPRSCGAENVYKVGGAQAIAALAWGTNPFRGR